MSFSDLNNVSKISKILLEVLPFVELGLKLNLPESTYVVVLNTILEQN